MPTRGRAVAGYLTERKKWSQIFFPGLRQGFAVAWPALLALVLGGPIAMLARRRDALERVVAVAVLAGFAAYLFTPFTADAGGLTFAFNLRYLTPVLLASLALLPRALPATRAWRVGLVAVLVAGVVVNAFARHHERIAAWPSREMGVAVVGGLLVVAITVLWRLFASHADRANDTAIRVSVAAIAGAAFVVLLWPVQHGYLDRRYVGAGLPLDAAYGAFHDVHDAKVAVFGLYESYPMFGTDLSNAVWEPAGPTHGTPRERCRAWRRLLDRGRYDYVVISNTAFSFHGPAAEWVAADPAVETIVHRPNVGVYRIMRPLDPRGCVAST
jgi:hypothetical protein